MECHLDKNIENMTRLGFKGKKEGVIMCGQDTYEKRIPDRCVHGVKLPKKNANSSFYMGD